jgi:hypothetical protein
LISSSITTLISASFSRLHLSRKSLGHYRLALGLLVASLSLKALAATHLGAKQVALATTLTVIVSIWIGVHLPSLQTEHWLGRLGASLAGNEKPVHRQSWLKDEAAGRHSE